MSTRRRRGRHANNVLPDELVRRQLGTRRHARSHPFPSVLALVSVLALGVGSAGLFALRSGGSDVVKPTRLVPDSQGGRRQPPAGRGATRPPPPPRPVRSPSPTMTHPTVTPRVTVPTMRPKPPVSVPPVTVNPPAPLDEETPTPTCTATAEPKAHSQGLGVGRLVRGVVRRTGPP